MCYTVSKNALSRECGNERNVMLNEDKIRLMNEIAMFRKNEWKSERPARMYFRGDYVAKHLLQSFFAYTLSYCLFLAVASLYSLERILNSVDVMEAVRLARNAAVLYFLGLAAFEGITLFVYRRKYAAAVKKQEEYLMKINRLKKRYDVQDRMRELSKEGGRNA